MAIRPYVLRLRRGPGEQNCLFLVYFGAFFGANCCKMMPILPCRAFGLIGGMGKMLCVLML